MLALVSSLRPAARSIVVMLLFVIVYNIFVEVIQESIFFVDIIHNPGIPPESVRWKVVYYLTV